MSQHRAGARFLLESGLGYLIFEPCELFSTRQNEMGESVELCAELSRRKLQSLSWKSRGSEEGGFWDLALWSRAAASSPSGLSLLGLPGSWPLPPGPRAGAMGFFHDQEREQDQTTPMRGHLKSSVSETQHRSPLTPNARGVFSPWLLLLETSKSPSKSLWRTC